MEIAPVDPRIGLASALYVARCIALILVVIWTSFGLRTFKKWLRTYMILKELPGPDDTFPPYFLLKTLWSSFTNDKTSGKSLRPDTVIRDLLDSWPDPDEGICKVYAGFTPIVFITRARAAEAFFKDNVNISKASMYRFIDQYIPSSLLTATGDMWRFQRKLVTPAFHFKAIDGFMTIFNKHGAAFVDYLNEWPAEDGIPLFREVNKCTTNVIAEATLGEDLNAFSSGNPYGEALTRLQGYLLYRSVRPYMWIDWIYYKFTREGAYVKQLLDSLHGLSGRIADQRLAERKEEESAANKVDGRSAPPEPADNKMRTFLEIYMDAHEQNPTLVTKRLVQTGVDSMLFAGQDTTGTSVTWMIFLLGHHPEIQDKCRQEVFRVLGSDPSTFMTSEHVKMLTYLEASFKEAMRKYAPIPLIGRQLETDIEIKGNGKFHTIPAGVHVFTSMFHMHRDPEFFPNPEKFDPERFLDEDAPHKAHPLSYVPWSCGPRNCLGQKFAQMEQKVIVAYLLRNFRWTSITPEENLRLTFQLVLRAKGDLRIKVEPLRGGSRSIIETSSTENVLSIDG